MSRSTELRDAGQLENCPDTFDESSERGGHPLLHSCLRRAPAGRAGGILLVRVESGSHAQTQQVCALVSEECRRRLQHLLRAGLTIRFDQSIDAFVNTIRARASSAYVIDPAGMSGAAFQAVSATVSATGAALFICTSSAPSNLVRVTDVACLQVVDVVLHDGPEQARPLARLITRGIPTVTAELLHLLAPGIGRLPLEIRSAAVLALCGSPVPNSCEQFASVTKWSLKTVERRCHRAGLGSVGGLLNAARLAQAASLFASPTARAGDVAAAAGYSTPARLRRHLNKYSDTSSRQIRAGLTPAEIANR